MEMCTKQRAKRSEEKQNKNWIATHEEIHKAHSTSTRALDRFGWVGGGLMGREQGEQLLVCDSFSFLSFLLFLRLDYSGVLPHNLGTSHGETPVHLVAHVGGGGSVRV